MTDLSGNAAYQELKTAWQQSINNIENARAAGVEPNVEDLMGSVVYWALAKAAEAIIEGTSG